jgi:hypothetical protein
MLASDSPSPNDLRRRGTQILATLRHKSWPAGRFRTEILAHGALNATMISAPTATYLWPSHPRTSVIPSIVERDGVAHNSVSIILIHLRNRFLAFPRSCRSARRLRHLPNAQRGTAPGRHFTDRRMGIKRNLFALPRAIESTSIVQSHAHGHRTWLVGWPSGEATLFATPVAKHQSVARG